MSVMKPGVSSSAPPKMIRAPSTISRAGIRPSDIAALKRPQACPPCLRSSQAPSRLSKSSSAIVGNAPMALPTWMITYSSASGSRMKTANSRRPTGPI